MPDVTYRVSSLQAAIKRIRDDLPAIEWRTGQILGVVADLAEIAGALASGGGQVTAVEGSPATVDREREASRRQATVDHLLWLAVRSIPAGMDGAKRDAEIRRVMLAWGATGAELDTRGYAG